MVQKTFKEFLQDFWDALLPFVYMNLLWMILTILVLPAFPAYAGLIYASNKIANGEEGRLKLFFDGFKEYFWVSWKYGAINIIFYVLVFLNIRHYTQYEGTGFVLLQYFFLSAAILWSMLQVYVFPLLLEQDEPTIRKALWNSVVIFSKFPARSLGLCILVLVILAVSVFVPPLLVLISFSFLAYLANWRTIWAIQELGVKSDR